MRMALALAEKARGATFPNPLVGAIIARGAMIVGQGFHKKAGGPHAEIFSLKQAGRRARGATLYCTFEPCAHIGRTGPCTEAIIQAGIKNVVVGMIDPNPVNRGRGVRRLRQAGLNVKVGFCEAEIRRLNAPFVSAMTRQRPLVTIKVAASLDGKIATRSGDSKWITSEATRRFARGHRRFFDAIMAGIRTVLQDDPRLEPGGCSRDHALVKIIVDSQGRLPLGARLFKTRQKVIVATLKNSASWERALGRLGVTVVTTRPDRGRVDLRELLRRLHDFEIRNLLVEGGAELIGALCDQRLADRAMIYLAPLIIGGREALGAVGAKGAYSLKDAIHLKNETLSRIGRDFLIEGELTYGACTSKRVHG